MTVTNVIGGLFAFAMISAILAAWIVATAPGAFTDGP